MSSPIPVTVLSGFLGSGKTTLLRHLLSGRSGKKIALLVNDMAEINIDSELIRRDVSLSHADERLVELHNGCICCTLRGDLLRELDRLGREGGFDAIVIESSGIAEPVPIAQTLAYRDEETGIDLPSLVRLDTMVTVVDARAFLRDFGTDERVSDRGWQTDETDIRSIVELMTEQIEFCDVLVANKVSELSDDERERVRRVLRGLQPTARYIETDWGIVDFDEIVDTGLFDMERAETSPLWARELLSGGHAEHTPETEEYGISSFVYRRDRPLHPGRFWALANSEWPGVIRSKWLIWLASRPEYAADWSQTGGAVRVDPAGTWPRAGGLQELAVITIAGNRAEIEAMLDSALLTDEEYAAGESVWRGYPDEFPAWR